MSTEEDLAGRFFALWAEYLTALSADPQMTEIMRRWVAIMPAADGAAPGDSDALRPRPAADAAAAAGASGERDAAVAELSRRIDELVERVGVLEQAGRPAVRARRRNPPRGS